MNFEEAVKFYKKQSLIDKSFTNDDLRIETQVESLKDWSELIDIQGLEKLFLKKQNDCKMLVEEIDLNKVRDWLVDKNTGNIKHSSNHFFAIKGLRISNSNTREVGNKGWDQPIIQEKNNDGGILGIIRKKINKIPYYLINFKAEPGNPDLIQISPCLQATYSNINQSHGGQKPSLSEYFLSPEKEGFKVIFEQLMSEDGGRLYKKKNKGMIIEHRTNIDININKNFYWLSLYQIKYLIKNYSWVNPHVRSLISHL